jgi:cytochrome c-type biogenesis protein CcmE
VIYRGVLPDLFREGQSVIAKGRIADGVFVADQVLAKHDETYMPAEVADKMTQARKAQQLKQEAEALRTGEAGRRGFEAPLSRRQSVLTCRGARQTP